MRAKSREKQFQKQSENEEYKAVSAFSVSLCVVIGAWRSQKKRKGGCGKWLNSRGKPGIF